MSLRVLIILLLGLAPAAVFAANPYYLQFEIFKFQQKIESGKDYASDKEHVWSKGMQRSYLKLTCDPAGKPSNNRQFTTEDHFAGFLVKHYIASGNLHFRLTRVDVQPRFTEIRALKKTECQELEPIVTTSTREFVTPLAEAANKTYAFSKEMSIRISLSELDNAK